MDFALVFLVQRFFYRLFEFFRHWYVVSSKYLWNTFFSFIEKLDHTLAIKITLRYFFEPLYKDYTIVGRILGMIFRSGRILIAAVIYLVISFVFLIFYLFWLLAPVLIIINAFRIV